MDYRRYCRWAEWSLVALIVGLNVAVFFWRENPSRPNFLLTSAHDAQLLAAIVLIIGWIVLGPGPLWVRLAASPFLVGLWLLPWNTAMQPRDVAAGFLVALFLASLLFSGALRACGLQIARSAVASGQRRGAQFSLLGLIVATTLIGIAVGGLEAARPTLNAMQGPGSLGSFISLPPSAIQARSLVLAAMTALAGLSGIWITLRPGAIWIRLAMVIVLVPAAALYLAHLSGASGSYIGLTTTTPLIPMAMGLTGALGAPAAVCCLCALPLRFSDFRLQRPLRSPVLPTEPAEEPFAVSKRVAAIGLLLVAIGMLPLSARVIPQRVMTYTFPVNMNGGEIIVWNAFTPENQTPLNALGAWIDPNTRPIRLLLNTSDGSVRLFSWYGWSSMPYPLTNVLDWSSINVAASSTEENKNEQAPGQP